MLTFRVVNLYTF